MVFPMSVEKNLFYVLKYHGKLRSDSKDRVIREALEKVKLYDAVKDNEDMLLELKSSTL